MVSFSQSLLRAWCGSTILFGFPLITALSENVSHPFRQVSPRAQLQTPALFFRFVAFFAVARLPFFRFPGPRAPTTYFHGFFFSSPSWVFFPGTPIPPSHTRCLLENSRYRLPLRVPLLPLLPQPVFQGVRCFSRFRPIACFRCLTFWCYIVTFSTALIAGTPPPFIPPSNKSQPSFKRSPSMSGLWICLLSCHVSWAIKSFK